MFYLIYKITNKLDGKIYIGSHKTKNINDDYMGSGKYLNHAYKKHGIENFIKEILFVYDNAKDMYTKEAELVNEDFLAEANTYNLKKGGFGGFDYINNIGLNNKANQCSKGGKKVSTNGGGFKGKTHSEDTKKYLSKILTRRPGTFNGRTHTDSTKQQMRDVKKGTGLGKANSQFGTVWITNGKENLKIQKDKISKYYDLGYSKGRKV
jgi:group I intron endonuclease